MKNAYLRFLFALLLLLALLPASAALAETDRFAALRDYIVQNNITLTESDSPPGGEAHTKADFLRHESDMQFVDLPDGGFIAVYGDVTILDDLAEDHTITQHPEGYILGGEGLISLASAEDFAGTKTLVISRTDAGGLDSLHCGMAHSFDAATGLVTMASAEETPHMLNYIAGFRAGGESASVLKGLLGADGSQYPFDLKNIPLSGDITADMQGYFTVDGSVPSADFWPWEFDLRVQCAVTMHVDSFQLHFTSPSVNATFDIIPLSLPIVPEVLTLDCSPKFFISGMLDGNLDFGFEFTLGGELHVDSDFDVSFDTRADADSWLNSADMRAEIYAGLDFGASLNAMGVAAIGLHYKLGLVAEAKVFTNPETTDRWHACHDLECLQGNIHPRKGPLSIDLDMLDGLLTKTLWSLVDPTDYDPLVFFHDSFTYGGGFRLTRCPHYAYRVDVTVKDAQGRPVEGALVSYENPDERYASVSQGTTNAEGVAAVYIPDRDPQNAESVSVPGYTVTLNAVIGSGEDALSAEPFRFFERGLDEHGAILEPTATLTISGPSYTVACYLDALDGNGIRTEPYKTSTRLGVPGSTVSLTEADRAMITDENGTRYLLDEKAEENVLSGTVQPDGSLELKLIFRRCGVIQFDAGGGSGQMDPIYALFGEFVPLPQCLFEYAQDGWAFQGWDAFQMINGPGTKVALTLNDLETLVVTAVWHEVAFGEADFVLPDDLTEIGPEAFRGIAAARISVPAGCRSIASRAFSDISHPLYIRIPEGCAVEAEAFADCENVYIFAPPGSDAQAYCKNHANCTYVYWTKGW